LDTLLDVIQANKEWQNRPYADRTAVYQSHLSWFSDQRALMPIEQLSINHTSAGTAAY
jgi:hypothetical protein